MNLHLDYLIDHAITLSNPLQSRSQVDGHNYLVDHALASLIPRSCRDRDGTHSTELKPAWAKAMFTSGHPLIPIDLDDFISHFEHFRHSEEETKSPIKQQKSTYPMG